jgi:ABC-type transport system involved in cytochrome c biogenesis permease component
MMRWLNIVVILIGKEIRLEWRGKEFLTLLVCNSIVISILVGAGVSSSVIDARTTTKVFPMLLWTVFLLSGTSAVSRTSESELEGHGFEGLLLAGVTGAQMYLAKVAVTAALFLLNFLLLLTLLSATLDQKLLEYALQLVAIGAGACLALAALVVLLVGVAGTSRLRGVLVPLLALPLLFPLFFAGVEMTSNVVLYGGLPVGSVWPSILVCINALYVILGINLFELAIRE